jgi:hypothetical protein
LQDFAASREAGFSVGGTLAGRWPLFCRHRAACLWLWEPFWGVSTKLGKPKRHVFLFFLSVNEKKTKNYQKNWRERPKKKENETKVK